MSDPEPTIDSAIDEAARVLAETRGVDYCHASGQHQAYWRREAQTVVGAWQEGRRRCEEENVPSAAPSLRAELAEAKAEIARLTEQLADELAHQRQAAKDYSNVVGPMIRERDATKTVVEAATALVEHRRGLNHWNGAIENDLINKLIDAVTAVEEGNKP